MNIHRSKMNKPQCFSIDECRHVYVTEFGAQSNGSTHRKGRKERKAQLLKCLNLDGNHPTGNTDGTDYADTHGYDYNELVLTETNSGYSNFGG